MKHTVYSIVLLILALMVVFASSCSSDPDEPVENKAKFTVMLYGCGGATLDEDFL